MTGYCCQYLQFKEAKPLTMEEVVFVINKEQSSGYATYVKSSNEVSSLRGHSVLNPQSRIPSMFRNGCIKKREHYFLLLSIIEMFSHL